MATWGTPDATTFAKKQIRTVTAGGLELRAHRLLEPILSYAFERLLAGRDETPVVVSFPEHEDGRTIESTDPWVGELLEEIGFVFLGDNLWRFVSTPEDIPGLPVESETFLVPEDLPRLPLPGSRELRVGDTGGDVLFLQMFLDAPRTGVFDDPLRESVRALQEASGSAGNGSVFAWVDWSTVFPWHRSVVESLDAGRRARVAVCALAVATGEHSLEIPATFGIVAGRLARDFQRARGLRQASIVGPDEWALLTSEEYRSHLPRTSGAIVPRRMEKP